MLQPQPDHELRPRLPVRGVAAEDECGRGEAGQPLQPRPLPARLPRGLQDRAANEPKQSFTVLTKPPSVMIFWDKCPAVSHLLTVFKRTFSLYLNRFLIVKALEGPCTGTALRSSVDSSNTGSGGCSGTWPS